MAKKIGFVIPRAYYAFNESVLDAGDKVGGVQKQSYLQAISLAKDNNYEVHFCVADFGQEEQEEIRGVKLWKSFSFNDNIVKRALRLFRTMKKVDADVYIFHAADTGVAAAVFYLRFFLQKKTIYMIALDTETQHKRLLAYSGFVFAQAMKYVYKKADIITAQTKQQKTEFLEDRKREPEFIIPYFYPPLLQEINYEKKNTILWVGRLDPIKNPELFFALAKKYPEEKFVMIAPVVRDFKAYGEKMQAEAKEIHNLQWISYVKPKEIMHYYLQAKIYVLSSDFEGFANTMAEAMQAGCAMLSYKVNTDNIFSEHQCGLYAANDQKQFFALFQQLNESFALRKNCGENGSRYIEKHHGETEIMTEYKKMLLSLF